MADSKRDLQKAVAIIRDGLKYELDQSKEAKETAFTARSRDVGIRNPNVERDVSKEDLAKGAMGAGYIAADYFLNPEKYSVGALKDKASVGALAKIVEKGEGFINAQLPPGLELNIDYGKLGLKDAREGRVPAVGASYERPVKLGRFKGTAGVRGRYNPEDKSSSVGVNVTGRFAKGGTVKAYSNSPRKPKLT